MTEKKSESIGLEEVEKTIVEHVNIRGRTTYPPDLTEEEINFFECFTEEQRKKVIWKIDVRLVPMLGLLYLLANIDRANIGNAKIEGLTDDLGLSSNQYNICLSIFFIPYCLLEVPSNIALKWFKKPSNYIAILAVSWSVVLTLTGIVQSYGGLMAARFFLGVTEAGFFPGALYIISTWYDRNEMGTRYSIFYMAAALAGAFSGLLAYLIVKMDGVAGIAGWRWIFIIEGLASIAVGLSTPFLLLDTPENSKILTNDERRYLILRKIIQDGGREIQSKGTKTSWPVLRSVVLDWKLYLAAIIYWTNTGTNYGVKFTMPQIIKNMGYSSANAQLLTVPPYILGCISSYIASRFSDRTTWRMPFIVVSQLVVLTGFAMLFGFAPNLNNRIAESYTAIFICCVGFYPITPNVAAWMSNNLAGPAKRASGIGFMLTMANTAGIIGSFMYKDEEKPRYPTGYGTSLGLTVAGMLAALLLEFGLWRCNKRDGKMSEEEVRAIYTEQELADMGDNSPLFKYTL
ncbi:unnamed protein product [Clonostachys rhizophaga]|uniref:Major facilitator superfamily (MFS) profile domain-containing protein n=1 Tax=Clonostachys rhizophaga TaxID=160324 RepID=A0A9N9YTN0_9HYPO|nr:unnamed protein product [Clonostachys rhizophaga]